ncbi:cholecystokinin receptor type A-like [Ruditapes philippinarum]|uniref:cholecystokinin receptor type A-like n=1 Tax=Ruditapes philippinarum TaxID=129788 RepID=UPI00295B92D0|nr:cholecystokinin receptor type A-like [Ruditapes philippinarum]
MMQSTTSNLSQINKSKDKDILEALNSAEIKRLIPTVVFLLIIFVGGLIGNSVIIHVYRTWYKTNTSTKNFIVCLGLIDLLTCCFGIPSEIITLLDQHTFENIWLCKLCRAINTLGTNSSGFLLIIIAVDRFRKVCKPFGWQIKTFGAKCLCGLVVFLGVLLSCPALLIYGKHSYYIPELNITATECSSADEIVSLNLPFYNALLYGILAVTGITTLWVLYCLIGLKIKQQTIKMNAKQGFKKERVKEVPTISYSRTNVSNVTAILNTCTSVGEYCYLENNKEIIKKEIDGYNISRTEKRIATSTFTKAFNISRSDKTKTSQFTRKQAQVRQTSFLTFVVTLAFVLSSIPHQVLMLVRQINEQFVDEMSDTSKAVYKFFLRSYFLNSAINPIIYSIFDSNFRSACRKSFCRCIKERTVQNRC